MNQIGHGGVFLVGTVAGCLFSGKPENTANPRPTYFNRVTTCGNIDHMLFQPMQETSTKANLDGCYSLEWMTYRSTLFVALSKGANWKSICLWYFMLYFYSPPAESCGPGRPGGKVPRGFHQGSTRVLQVLRGGASTKKSPACCWGYHHLSLSCGGGGEKDTPTCQLGSATFATHIVSP